MKIVAGIDEVGRGPLAGPVTVCVVSCTSKSYEYLRRNKFLPKSGKDSKALSVLEREKYFNVLKLLSGKGEISYAVTHISNTTIDSKGISFSINKALKGGIKKLKLHPLKTQILLDGSLKAPKEFKNQRTIIKGDKKEKIISWASILAKVSRDKLMTNLAKKFPEYGFGVHKGYGTEKHRKAIKKHGLSKIHRKTFTKI